MKSNKGQALIEFIMVLPILLLIMMAIYDIGNIIYQKYNLQNDLDIISEYISNYELEQANSYANNKNIVLTVTEDGNFANIKLEYKFKLNTPGLSNTLGNPYKLKLDKKVIRNNTNNPLNINNN